MTCLSNTVDLIGFFLFLYMTFFLQKMNVFSLIKVYARHRRQKEENDISYDLTIQDNPCKDLDICHAVLSWL